MKLITLLMPVVGCTVIALAGGAPRTPFLPEIPRVWDDAALAEWATPLAGLNLRPTHMSSSEYYATPVDNLKTYPVYAPDREPAGYWEMLRKVGPTPLLQPEALTNDSEWVAAGRRVFEEADAIALRTYDAEFIDLVRSAESVRRLGADVTSDGTLPDLRWVPTEKGVALSVPICSNCHTQRHRDGRVIIGAPAGGPLMFRTTGIVPRLHPANRVVPAASPFVITAPMGEAAYQAWGVPWLANDRHQQLKDVTGERVETIIAASARSGGAPRWNGSPYYPAKAPDLIGIKDRKYIDHTATHLHRGIGDLMRYAALNQGMDMLARFGDFVPAGDAREVGGGFFERAGSARYSDEQLYALARYIYSLKPPPNPNTRDALAVRGQRVFEAERCGTCHTPPIYTNNALTPAPGFTVPEDHFKKFKILPRSVGTDPTLTRTTRRGTGYYKVPSLKGVWYRGPFEHNGSVATLEDWFDPRRLRNDYVPTAWKGYGVTTRAVPGHEFGLKLPAEDKRALIAFLKTL